MGCRQEADRALKKKSKLSQIELFVGGDPPLENIAQGDRVPDGHCEWLRPAQYWHFLLLKM